jgi:hypothetical protein
VRFRLLAVFCAFLWICGAVFAQKSSPSPADFSFTQNDLNFLAYCDQIDQNFEQRHLI